LHITITLYKEDQVALPCTEELQKLSDNEIYNKQRNLRHPIALYSKSLNTALKSLEELTNATRELLFSQENSVLETAKEKTKSYLLDLFTHLEDCKAVLKTVYPPEQEKELQKALRNFSSLIESFRKHIAIQANKIKHNQSEIRTITFHWSAGFSPGYFIESMLPNEVLGPDPEVHPQSNSAFSYAREIRKSICGIFFVSSALATAIREKTKKPINNQQRYSHPQIEKISEIIRLYFDFYFPDEIHKPNPRVELKNSEIKISYPSKIKPKAMPQRVRIKTTLAGDGYTKSFALPYFKEGQ